STSCCSTSPAAKASAAEEPDSDGSSCGGMIGAENPAADSGHRDNLLVEGSDDDMTTCPAMVGNPVNKQDAEEQGLFRDYYAQRSWLSCPGCGPTRASVMVADPVNKQDAEEAGLCRDDCAQRFWLCCPGCGPTFDSDPAKYAANMA